jgi:hypothetical protein
MPGCELEASGALGTDDRCPTGCQTRHRARPASTTRQWGLCNVHADGPPKHRVPTDLARVGNAVTEPHLITPDDPAWSSIVDNVDRRLTCMTSCGHRLGCHATEAWVWGAGPPWGVQYGFGVFDRPDMWSEWDLRQLHFAPSMLRGGRLPAVWPKWRERYGDFGVDRPSAPMMGFLAARGYAPRDSPLEVNDHGRRPSVLEIDLGYWAPVG